MDFALEEGARCDDHCVRRQHIPVRCSARERAVRKRARQTEKNHKGDVFVAKLAAIPAIRF